MNDDSTIPRLENGVYLHTKSGNKYEVIGIALETETHNFVVVYSPLYEHPEGYKLFSRPYEMFTGMVTIDGAERPRFEKIDS